MRFLITTDLMPDIVGLLILALLMCFSLSDLTHVSRSTQMFRFSTAVCIVGTLADIVTIMIWPQCQALSRSTVYTANVLYFITCPLAELTVTWYVLSEIYAELPGTHRGQRVAAGLNTAFYAVFEAMLVCNGSTGWVFTLDEQNNYYRGSMFWLNMVYVFAIILVVLVCFLIHLKEEDRIIGPMMLVLFCISVLLVMMQQYAGDLQITGTVLGLVQMTMFITCQRRKVNQDPMTGIGTRSGLLLHMARLIRRKEPFTLQTVNLRDFRRVNRRYGPVAADGILRQMARHFRSVYPGENCYRAASTVFTVVHEHSADEGASMQLDVVRERFRRTWDTPEGPARVSATFAQASYPQDGTTAEALINALEFCSAKARYKAPGTMTVFDEKLRAEMLEGEHIQDLIQTALTGDNLVLNFQPVQDVQTGKICAAEMLLRLRDGDGSIVMPDRFIPVAEASGSIVNLTWVALEQVLAYIRDHRECSLPPVSVNLSVQQFLEPAMCETLQSLLEQYGVEPRQLKIEITERVAAADEDLVRRNLQDVGSLGIGTYMDDFGTGYSNLASMASMRPEVVKIDKSLLPHMPDVRRDRLLGMIIGTLKETGAKVLIEGVETAEQRERVCRLGVERIQGFFYARPMSGEAFAEFLRGDNQKTGEKNA